MTTFKLTLAYDGTDFIGWQRQTTGRSVQGVIEEVLSRIEGAPVPIIGAGRTDAGVHALGQVASVHLSHQIQAPELRQALNATLPADVRVLFVQPVADDFHARYSTHAKSYRYHIISDEMISPFERRFAWHVPARLETAAMKRAAEALKGRHDFAAFQSAGSDVPTTVREITFSQVSVTPVADTGLDIVYDVTGDGFLRHMVRAIVGTLVDVGMGRIKPDAMEHILASRDRHSAGATAPPHGLFLVAVYYDHDAIPAADKEADEDLA